MSVTQTPGGNHSLASVARAPLPAACRPAGVAETGTPNRWRRSAISMARGYEVGSVIRGELPEIKQAS